MWLLNSGSGAPELSHFVDNDLREKRPYAILSHRWEDEGEEIPFEELRSSNISTKKKGWYKIDKSRQQARAEHLDYV